MFSKGMKICQIVKREGGKAYFVGGYVRDKLMGVESKDLDIEVFGLSQAALEKILFEEFGKVKLCGKAFAVLKLDEIDISLPRRERKVGKGHKGFDVTPDENMSLIEASARRDFTINAIMYDPLKEIYHDCHGGIKDIEKGIIRKVRTSTFIEDPLRVLRAAQFAGRFNFKIEHLTKELCWRLDLNELPGERVWIELEKLLLKSDLPSVGLNALLELGVIHKLFPELWACYGCTQNPAWHPEGDVWKHITLVVDYAKMECDGLSTEKQIALLLGALCHDLGKPAARSVENGIIRNHSHDELGVEPTARMLNRLKVCTINGYPVRKKVLELVRHHMKPFDFHRNKKNIRDGAFRRIAGQVDPDLLVRLAKADALGKRQAYHSEMVKWFLERLKRVKCEKQKPQPILMGRHLLEMGVQPGPRMGKLLDAVMELQLDGEVSNLKEAKAAANRIRIKEAENG